MRYVNFMAGKLITDDRRCLHWSTACTSIPNDHFIGTTNTNANSRWRNSLEKAMTFFLCGCFLSGCPHHTFYHWPMITFHTVFFSFFCLSMPSAVWKLSVFAGNVCVVILLLSFDSGCKCIYWYHQCRVCIFVQRIDARVCVPQCEREKNPLFFFFKISNRSSYRVSVENTQIDYTTQDVQWLELLNVKKRRRQLLKQRNHWSTCV